MFCFQQTLSEPRILFVINFIIRSDITVVCKAMEFGQFPLDKHKCYFILTSCKLFDIFRTRLLSFFLMQKKNRHISIREGLKKPSKLWTLSKLLKPPPPMVWTMSKVRQFFLTLPLVYFLLNVSIFIHNFPIS